MDEPRTGQAPEPMSQEAFRERFLQRFLDPAFRAEDEALGRIAAIAWEAYREGRKSPLTRKAGPQYADPDYDLSAEWHATRERLRTAQAIHDDPASRSRALVICAAARNDGTCPGEVSKTWRLARLACDTLSAAGVEPDLLDLSHQCSEYDRRIHPCKGCVSTAMPLCHWPCSCYPNHALGQAPDAMGEIYERWVRAHGVLIVTPVYWYQSPAVLKLMIDRLVCADGGNPDPTTTHGKDPARAKALERAGWDYPKHLAGRAYGLVVHGDVAGIDGQRRDLSDWLDWMGLIDAGPQARLDRYIGYWQPYADSHAALDADAALHEEVRNVARALASAVGELRAGRSLAPDAGLRRPRPK